MKCCCFGTILQPNTQFSQDHLSQRNLIYIAGVTFGGMALLWDFPALPFADMESLRQGKQQQDQKEQSSHQ